VGTQPPDPDPTARHRDLLPAAWQCQGPLPLEMLGGFLGAWQPPSPGGDTVRGRSSQAATGIEYGCDSAGTGGEKRLVAAGLSG